MSCPSGVPDAYRTNYGFVGYKTFEISDFTSLFVNPHFAIEESNSCTVVTSVFQPFKAFEDDWSGLLMADIANNSTHKICLFYQRVYDFKMHAFRICTIV